MDYKCFLHCEHVSSDFFYFLLRMAIYEGVQNNFICDGEAEKINVEEKLDELIGCGVWDWKNEVRERKYLYSIDFDVEQCRKETEYLVSRQKGWGYYE